MNRVYYYLIDKQGKAYQGVGADTVSISTEADVADFRKRVWGKNKDGLLKGFSAVQLEVFAKKDDSIDSTKKPLNASGPVGDRHADEDTALYVVVPKKT
ncbi:UNVERIFIED_CONTAM: hypothetical protein HDU68_006892, partial [Siphonaria sp. JEL0065]